MLVGALCDVADGAAARLLGSVSALGRELDSLADLVTFGVTPAFLLYNYIRPLLVDLLFHPDVKFLMLIAPFFLPLFAAWRLARFNVESAEDGACFFVGLPTPFQGLFWAVWIVTRPEGNWLHPLVWTALITLIAAFMVSRWPFLSLKKPLRVLPWLSGIIVMSGISFLFFPWASALIISLISYAGFSYGAFWYWGRGK
jgi:CDP-diacylglycerol--serine O-phosphatidyltransferase